MEGYIASIWSIILTILNFMSSTVILTVGGIQITFLGLAIFVLLMGLLFWVFEELLGFINWGD